MEEMPVKAYRGPPPRGDLVQSPCRQRDWVGNDLFNMADENNTDERRQVSLNGDNLGIAPGLHGDYVDPHFKTQRDYGSNYSKLAMQGGHKGLLQMNSGECLDEMDVGRKHKGCDNISEYNRVAKQGGHRDLLSMESNEQQEPARKLLGEGTSSEYIKLAKQGGHKDLLVIEENKPSNKVTATKSSSGDWFSHSDNNNSNHTKKAASPVAREVPEQSGRQSTFALPGGSEQLPKCGKKRFEQSSQKRDAPFATNY